ncbi:retrovirus-related pol polyprotein from transposon TNT 1-94 [Tanacetum coccineum]|uniref:Retrovirus-related pol polyprotein from transposon TNT 1-94 n=1 Tax=Tanacetum coccineum TaxID=301880 RepID=A0ABQ5BT59_9ASTR
MQKELNQSIANDIWELVPQPRNMTIIGTKWVFRNKLDENGVISRNKARLVAQGYNQQEGIDYDETYAQLLDLSLGLKSFWDKDSLGAQEDASKKGRSFEDIDKDAEIWKIGENQREGKVDDKMRLVLGVEDSDASYNSSYTAGVGYKGKAIMIKPEVLLKKKDQVTLDEEMARNLEAQLQAKLIEEERLARKNEEEANIALIKSWDIHSKKQKTDENEEVEVDNEGELKKHMVTVKDDDIAIDAIPLATKPPVIVEYKLIREGIMGHYQLIRADGSFKIYSSMIRMLQGIDREDLHTL